jgi:exonuclease VII small subunit
MAEQRDIAMVKYAQANQALAAANTELAQAKAEIEKLKPNAASSKRTKP